MFANKSTIITGANKNLGKETAIAFAKEGSNILLHYHSNSSAEETKTLADTLIKDYGIKAVAFQGDLSKEETTTKMFDVAIEEFGSVDYAIDMAGSMIVKKLADSTLEDFNFIFDINVKASFFFLRECENRLAENGSVIMITTSLLAAYNEGYSLYQAAKSAVYWMCKTASKETKKKITYNCVSPGPINTPFLHSSTRSPEAIKYLESQAIENRLAEVEDIVPFIKFLVKDGKWMTGQNLYANNGFLAPSA